jgi:hypothetical protein
MNAPRSSRRLWILLTICAMALGGGGVWLLLRGADAVFEGRKAAPSAAELARWVGVWLPPEPSHWQSYAEGWQDWQVVARFELTTSQRDEFLQRNHLEPQPPTTPSTSAQALLQRTWFAPSATARTYTTAAVEPGAATGFTSTAWIDEHGDTATVFLYAFDR